MSRCPGTRAAAKISGQTPGCPGTKPGFKIMWKKEKFTFFFKDCIFQTFFSLLSRGCPRILQDRLEQAVKMPSWPIPWDNIKIPCPSLYHSRILSLSFCPVLPLSQDNKGTSVNGLLSCCPFVLGKWRDFSPFFPWDKKILSFGNPSVQQLHRLSRDVSSNLLYQNRSNFQYSHDGAKQQKHKIHLSFMYL